MYAAGSLLVIILSTSIDWYMFVYRESNRISPVNRSEVNGIILLTTGDPPITLYVTVCISPKVKCLIFESDLFIQTYFLFKT